MSGWREVLPRKAGLVVCPSKMHVSSTIDVEARVKVEAESIHCEAILIQSLEGLQAEDNLPPHRKGI